VRARLVSGDDGVEGGCCVIVPLEAVSSESVVEMFNALVRQGVVEERNGSGWVKKASSTEYRLSESRW
jgi:hypothetical protein